MVFAIRLRTSAAMKRMHFKSDEATWDDLQAEVQRQCGVAPADQLLSRTQITKPSYIEARGAMTLQKLSLKDGDILYLGPSPKSATDSKAAGKPTTASAAAAKPATSGSGSAGVASTPKTAAGTNAPASALTGTAVAASVAAAKASDAKDQKTAGKPAPKLTARCAHGPRGRCIYCDGVPQSGGVKDEKRPCLHGPGVTCLNCSAYATKKDATQAAEWLCNHPETAFCPKCIPKEAADAPPKALPCDCNKAKGQSCSRCIEVKPSIKTSIVPYRKYIDEKKAMCHFSHNANVTCASCAPPKMPNFVPPVVCPGGHKPFPAASCMQCAPPNIKPTPQRYRHCDVIAFNSGLAQQFYASWFQKTKGETQKAGILIGNYIDEPADTKMEGGVRAQVHAIYEPPQEGLPGGVRFLRDPNEKIVHELASTLKLEPVGWIITTRAREGAKYGGKVFMSSAEIRQAARFQNRYKNENGHSRFVTVVLEHGKQIEPVAYQVSDLAVAMERDAVFHVPTDPFMVVQRVPKPTEMAPRIIFKDVVIDPGTEFLPDEFIVKVIIATQNKSFSLFKHSDFPTPGSDAAVAVHFADHKNEEYQYKLSDFNLLCYLPHICGLPLAKLVAEAVRDKKALAAASRNQLDEQFLKKNLL